MVGLGAGPLGLKAPVGEARGSSSSEALEIRILSLGLTLLVVFLALDLEVHGVERSLEQVRLRLGAMVLATAWAGSLTVVAGFYAFPRQWKSLQPFEGGGGFVVVQAVGWTLYASALFAIVVLCFLFIAVVTSLRGL